VMGPVPRASFDMVVLVTVVFAQILGIQGTSQATSTSSHN
jgi:hypothetical protein